MANRKKEVYKPKPMTEGKRNLIQGLLQEYDIQSADDIQEALKDLLSGTLQDMLETEWTMSIRNWGKVRGELEIMYPDRLMM